jgi:type 1 glutamine amidotransferase/HEAT repeat protein
VSITQACEDLEIMRIYCRFSGFALAALLAACVQTSLPAVRAANAPVRVLLFSGQNNHDWKTTTPKLKSILEGSGRFRVDVTQQPEQCGTATFAEYDLVVSDWNAWGDAKVKAWPDAARVAFLDFIRSGKGYVSIHAGSSSFYDWPDYQQIGGMYWSLPVTSHGPPHEFTVQFTGDHPITRGLTPFSTKDELWVKPGVHPAAQVLATGDGQPLAVATALGQGRGFALLLGHGAEFMDTPGFQALLLRGAEWAATGKVTLRGAGDTRALDPDRVIGRVAAIRFGDDRQAVLALERLVQDAAADANARSTMAAKLAAALAAEASVEGKRCFLDGLSLVGSAAEVPAIVRALGDTNLFYHACQALERIPADSSTTALTAALATQTGLARATVLHSLGMRRAERAVPELARFVTDADQAVAAAALEALGAVGGTQAVAALQVAESKVAPALRELWGVSLLRGAESLRATGNAAQANALFAQLAGSGQPARLREAAFPAHVAALGERGTSEVLAALAGNDLTLRRAALRALRNSRDPVLLRAAMEKLASLPPECQQALILLCGERGDAALLPAVTQAAASSDAGVKRAAIQTLGLIGDATTVDTLARLGESGSEEDRRTLVEALARLRGPTVDPAILAALKAAPPSQQRTLLRALTAREVRTATPDLLVVATSPDATVRAEAIRTLGRLADGSACSALVQRLEQVTASDRGLVEGALVEICRRDAAAVPSLIAALRTAPPVAQTSLISVLGAIGGAPACAAVCGQLKAENAEVRLAAVRVLAEWPDAEPLDALAGVIEAATDTKIRALAARGLNRMAPQSPARAARAAEALARALAAATDVTEQKNLLAAVVGIPSLASLRAAQAHLNSPGLAADAGAGLLQIAEVIYPWHLSEVKAALAELQRAGPSPALTQRANALAAKLDQPANLARGGLASSPDGIEKDGAAGGDQAAIDGNPETYWDEEDNQKVYRLRVQLRERSTVGCLRILGWAQQDYVPKDFEVRCDDKVVKTVTNAQYQNRWLSVAFPPVTCDALELVITGSHGPSPAIRELELYEKPLPTP